MLDYQTIYEVGMARRDDMLREAAALRRASQVPSGPSALRAMLSRWLYALANKLEEPTRTPTFATSSAATRSSG